MGSPSLQPNETTNSNPTINGLRLPETDARGQQIAKTKAIRAAYLRRIDSGTDAGIPVVGKAGDAKSVGMLSK